MECYKCHGKGIIEGFSHVRGGICFMCNGQGVLPEAKKKNVGYSRSFVQAYQHNVFFPQNQSGMQTIKALASVGHPTAEKRLLTDGEFYYIGQPVCRASMWWKIPVDAFPEFAIHYNKVFKTAI